MPSCTFQTSPCFSMSFQFVRSLPLNNSVNPSGGMLSLGPAFSWAVREVNKVKADASARKNSQCLIGVAPFVVLVGDDSGYPVGLHYRTQAKSFKGAVRRAGSRTSAARQTRLASGHPTRPAEFPRFQSRDQPIRTWPRPA